MRKTKISALLAAVLVSLNASAVQIPVIDMADICTRYFQGDPAAIANYETLKDGKYGIDPVKTCADFKASGALDEAQPVIDYSAAEKALLTSTANAEGIKKVEPGVPHFNEDGTVTVEALVTDEAGQREQCVFTMTVERGEKDGSATTKLVEKSSVCTPAKS